MKHHILLAVLAATATLSASISLPPNFDDNMILQRGKPLPIYGKAAPQESVTVSFANQKITAVADDNGDWTATLKPLTANAVPQTMTISGSNTITLKNILVGDVWFASGQSNMQVCLPDALNPQEEIRNANHPDLRFFLVKMDLSSTPQTQAQGKWCECTSQNAPRFPAAAYFFARELQRLIHVPIGIIANAVGSSGCECWVPADVLATNPSVPQLPDWPKEEFTDWATYNNVRMAVYNDGIYHDPGIRPECLEWAKPDYDDSSWKTMNVPVSIKRAGINIDGTVWFRHDIDLPQDCAGQNAMLNLSFVQHRSIAFFNGTELGRKSNDGREWVPHNYAVPGNLVKAGRNTIAVRITVDIGDGGFFPSYPRPLTFVCGKLNTVLANPWRYQVEAGRAPGKLARTLPSGYRIPAVLYNSMTAPYHRTPIRGFIWYQGESNAGGIAVHDIIFPMLINSWRERWHDTSLPFYFVQLPNYQPRTGNPNETGWSLFRESQARALALPHTGMAVTIDIGEANNVHPRNKQECGRRLALIAARDTYAQDIVASGPVFQQATLEGKTFRVTFNHVHTGLTIHGNALKGFAVSGPDKQFQWVPARIDGNDVLLDCTAIAQPTYIRYAWGNNPDATLFNCDGLPAAPFRTDK